MALPGPFELAEFAVLAGLGCLGIGRAVVLRRRGVRVVVADRERTSQQIVVDLLAGAGMLVWGWETIAHAWGLGWHIGPDWLHRPLVVVTAVRLVGVLLSLASLGLYAAGVLRLGDSWRAGIDRASPGPLVTTGVYGWTRHPIYLAFDLLFVGTFLALGRGVFLVLAVAWIPLMHGLMLREERFLAEQFGDAYREYCGQVRRYLGRSTRNASF